MVNSVSNTTRVKKAMENSDLSDESIDVIMSALNDVQERINEQTSLKLDNFVNKEMFQDIHTELTALTARTQKNEVTLK